MRIQILGLLSMVFVSSCTSSLIYSPTAGVPDKPLAQGEVVAAAQFEMLPETRPEGFSNTGRYTAAGSSIQLGYGFSNRFSLFARGSADIEGKLDAFRACYSLSGLYHWNLSQRSRILWLNRAGMSLNDNSVNGYGLQSMGLWQRELSPKWTFTAGSGIIWGFYALEKQINSKLESRIPMGWGIGLHTAIAYRLTPQWVIQGEFAPIWQFDTFEHRDKLLFSPMVGLSYRFKTINRNK